jgi:hypothetical protein
LIEQKARSECSTEEADFVDRGLGTMADVSTLADIKKVTAFFAAEETEAGWKFRTDHLMACSLCCRGQQMRNFKISAIGIQPCPKEGVNGCHAIRTVVRQSKKNKFNKNEESAFIRYVRWGINSKGTKT